MHINTIHFELEGGVFVVAACVCVWGGEFAGIVGV